MNFLFVACNKNKKHYREDPSFIYRCENLAYELEQLGHGCKFAHLSEIFFLKDVDVIIFHRPTFSFKLYIFSLYTKFKKIISIVEVDDLVFDPNYAADSPAFKNGILSLKKVEKRFLNTFKAFKLFSYFSVSTSSLHNHLKTLFKDAKIVVVPNSIHYSWKDIKKKNRYSNIKKISYFPGTKSHDKDFLVIAEQLTYFLKKFPDIQLHITGTLNFNLDLPKEQLFYTKKVSFDEYYKCFADAWINLAPLEITPFNECKSALKIIEAGYWGIPTICTPNSDVLRFQNAGAQIAINKNDWIEKLEYLNDEENYKNIQEEIKENFVSLINLDKFATNFVKFAQKNAFLLQKKSFLSNSFTSKVAKKLRTEGFYDYRTLYFYKKAWQKTKNAKNLVEYLSFRRDLGYKLSINKQIILKNNLHLLKNKEKQSACCLLNEVQALGNEECSIKDINKIIHDNQIIWLNEFQEALNSAADKKICIVGNSASLRYANIANNIDKSGIVIRFNKCFNDETKSYTGHKIDIWVCAPNFKDEVQERADWIILTGPNLVYKNYNFDRFEKYVKNGKKILGVPLNIWKELVFILKAPPSAGVLVLWWLKNILGGWNGICASGFDLSVKTGRYHHVNPRYLAGERHNWKLEKKLLIDWKSQGLEIIN